MAEPTKTWDELHEEGMGPTQEAFLDLVRQTRETKHYCPDVIWGNLQTPEYVRAMLALVVDFLESPRDIEAGVQARTARAELFGKDGRTYRTLLGEQALRSNIGGVEVMRGQLEHVLESFDIPGVTLGIIPSRAQLAVFPGNSFGIFDGQRVEVELFGSSPTYTDEAQIRRYETAFGLLEQSAVFGEDAKYIVQAELAAIQQ
ncbi:DUF5753 domain-containing protein [Streptomyces sp. NBC_01304]|uniref:DUF5753 domain-containing protein n=1 Tax=Streptomyces sp. NBC_01304 TaxID=2903818 RepID=UPI002E10F94D|nr:DUF5753 domain-containing protein [Streptomyces sp. NBC_01304]